MDHSTDTDIHECACAHAHAQIYTERVGGGGGEEGGREGKKRQAEINLDREKAKTERLRQML